MDVDDDGFDAFEAWQGTTRRVRSVLEVERARIAKGHQPDVALEKHGADIEMEILRELAYKGRKA